MNIQLNYTSFIISNLKAFYLLLKTRIYFIVLILLLLITGL